MGKGRAALHYLLVAMVVVAALLRPGAGASGSTTELRPDLRTAPLPTSSSGFRIETSGGTTSFSFSNGLQNGGEGPFEVTPATLPANDDCNNNGDPNDDVAMNQRIFLDSGDGVFERSVDTGQTLHPAGCMAFHQGHSHYHVDQMSNYRLISESTGAIAETSTKVTFCLVDNVRFDPSLPGSPPSSHYTTCGLGDQGISIGWHDVYHYSLEGQSFDVTDMPAGDYCLRSRIDPNNRFLETDETNNVAEQRYLIDPAGLQATALSGTCTIPSGPAPVNDAFSAPTAVTLGATAGTNIDATKEAGEPSHGGDDGGASVWYAWTPDEPLDVTAHTCGS
ncbi:MAG: lysyl oxidase family protein, partial [Actinomycetota bacterium]